MRKAAANDCWRTVYKRNYANYIKSITLDDCMGYSGTVSFQPGITAICGLNGVGKSTLISCIKNIVSGADDDSLITRNKSSFHNIVCADLVIDGKEISVKCFETAIDHGLASDSFRYIDSNQSMKLLELWSEQTNLDEYLESLASNNFTDDELRDISQLVGKKYKKCTSTETDEEAENYLQVHFRVALKDQEYTSVSMGLGEHFLLYMYYILKKRINKDSLVIIEEPESYISVKSQKEFMNVIAQCIKEKGISVIITTHSPHILENIKQENILIVSNWKGEMRICNASDDLKAAEHLGLKNVMQQNITTTIFVEDYAARLFLDILLREELPPASANQVDIVSVGGESDISERLSFDDSKYMSHHFAGVYDADMKGKLVTTDLKWPHLFLPIEECVEKEMNDYLDESEDNVSVIAKHLNVCEESLFLALNEHEGKDHHDWFLDICKTIGCEHADFIKAFYQVWKNENTETISKFANEISDIIQGKIITVP